MHSTQASRETWRDWLTIPIPDAELVTRQDILVRAKAEGFDIPEGSLVYWEKQGILPRAIRKWRDGKPAALYPPGVWAAVVTVPIMRRQHFSLDEIKRRVRAIDQRDLPYVVAGKDVTTIEVVCTFSDGSQTRNAIVGAVT